MFNTLLKINSRPKPFQFYTADELWTNEHTSAQMLKYHLNEDIDVSSRNARFIDRSVEWIVSHFKLNDGAKVIDFGCGPGLYTSRLARKGLTVTGIDFSQRSIEYAIETAKQESLPVRYHNADYLKFEPDDKYDLITMIMCDYCVLSPEQRKELLGKFRSALSSDGTVLLDVYSIKAFDEREENAIYKKNLLNGFWSPEEYFGFMNTFKYEDEKVVLDKYTIVEESRIRTVYNWLQYFTPESLTAEFRESGLEIVEIYADVAGSKFNPESAEFAIIARKCSSST